MKKTETTTDKLRAAIERSIETDPIPGIVLAHLRDRDGKRWDKRDATAIRERIEAETGLRAQASTDQSYKGGRTWLNLRTYWTEAARAKAGIPEPDGPVFDQPVGHRNNDVAREYTLNLCPEGDGPLRCLPVFFAESNPHHFGLRDERNAGRRALLADAARLKTLADAVDKINLEALYLYHVVHGGDGGPGAGPCAEEVGDLVDAHLLEWVRGVTVAGRRGRS